MTLRGMVRISALGAILLAAIALASSVARAQEPTIQRDTTNRRIWVGCTREVMDLTGLPQTVPARSYCVAAHRVIEGAVLVDSVLMRVNAELPECPEALVPLVIRPACGLLPEEYAQWVERGVRPVLVFCGNPPGVRYIAKAVKP